MGIKRVVDTAFWTDGKVDDFSPEDKYFMLYLLTSPFCRQLGIYEISIKQAAFQLGYSVEAVKVLLDRFETKYKMIRFSPGTNEIAIVNFLRHSVMKGGKPVEDCIRNDIAKVKDKSLIDFVFAALYPRVDLNVTVRKVIDEYVSEHGLHYDNDNDNDNDNENDRTGDESSTNRPNASQKPKRAKKPKPSKHKYGEYNNVLLTDDELAKLQAEYPDWHDRIERLSSYIAQSGKSYASHYATIRNWARKDEKEKAPVKKTYGKPTKAQELDDAYTMMAAWAESED